MSATPAAPAAARHAGEERLHPPDRPRGPGQRQARGRSAPASRPSPTATCTSATPRRSAWTSASPREFGGVCNLRFDDTNPAKEDPEYVARDPGRRALAGLRMGRPAPRLGLLRGVLPRRREADPPGRRLRLRPDAPSEVREYRGTLTEPGRNSPFRDRSVEENLDLFRRMRAGEFPDGARTLRAKIDMASGNINLRDPALYRIKHVDAPEHRQRLADLPDVRLRAFAVATRSKASPIRCARWSSRTTARCTTGAWTRSTWPDIPELLAAAARRGPAERGRQAAPDRVLARSTSTTR